MIFNASALSSLLSNTAEREHPVAYRHDKYLTREDFLNDIGRVRAELEHRREDRWGIFIEDTYLFAVTLFALLATGKTPVVLPSAQEAFINGLRGELQGLICDKMLSTTGLPELDVSFTLGLERISSEMPELDVRRAEIVLFTSGSTGQPKCISKSLLQLETELKVLDGLWGDTLKDTVVLSTVTHQHIYGLLFRLLWPLAMGRCFDSVTYNDPWAFLEQTERFSHIALVSSPAQLTRLPDTMDLSNLALKLAMVFSSGGPLPGRSAMALRRRFQIIVTEVLGSTETGGIAYRNQGDDGLETPWQPLPSVAVKCALGDNSLIIKSPFEGSGRWYTTADTVELFKDHRFLLKGRNDNVVKVEEKRLSLTELEHRLCACNLVAEAAAAVQQNYRVIVVVALVLSEQGSEFLRVHNRRELERQLKSYLLQYFEAVVLPKKWRYVEKLPFNAQGKVTHTAILELFAPAGTGLSKQ